MQSVSRRAMLRAAGVGLAGAAMPGVGFGAWQDPAAVAPRPDGLRVVNPRGRVPVSLIIDDSTCLVNLAYYGIPQFAEVFPDNYKQPWRELPREIPDAFVRRFGEWCAERGIKGKYSIVPYPACVGWLDRDLPGWSQRDLKRSLDLVRTLMLPNWDIHPEMVSHTWAVDTETGRPYPERTERFMENWGFSVGRSADFLADYLAFALRVLKNVGLPCEGVTTPGGFGSRARPALAQGTLEACRDVFSTEIPHYFRDLYTDQRSVAPVVYNASGLDGPEAKCVVSVIGCTGDWFGGWDGLEAGSVDRFITADLKGGRLPEIIAREEPAIMVGHWPGFYFNGLEVGFTILKGIVERLDAAYDHLQWMKLSEIARYWAARTLTHIETAPNGVGLKAPFACPDFTISIERPPNNTGAPRFVAADGAAVPLREVGKPAQLGKGTWHRAGATLNVCFDLPRGASRIELS